MKKPHKEHDFWIGEPMDVEMENLSTRRSPAFINSLTLAYQLHAVAVNADADEPGDEIAGITGPITIDTLDGDGDGNNEGDYYGGIAASAALDAALQPDTTYFLRIYGGSGTTAVNRFLKIRANYRAET